MKSPLTVNGATAVICLAVRPFLSEVSLLAYVRILKLPEHTDWPWDHTFESLRGERCVFRAIPLTRSESHPKRFEFSWETHRLSLEHETLYAAKRTIRDAETWYARQDKIRTTEGNPVDLAAALSQFARALHPKIQCVIPDGIWQRSRFAPERDRIADVATMVSQVRVWEENVTQRLPGLASTRAAERMLGTGTADE